MTNTKTPFKHIALWSSTPQQGKSTIARFLAAKHGYEVMSFASPLLEMIETFLMSHGLSMEEIDYYCRQAKEQPIPGVGRSYRYLARTLGTGWGRNMVRETTWLDAFEQKFDRHSSRNAICVDDMRFRNELTLLKKKNFVLVKVVRKNARIGIQDTHQSDIELASFDGWDREISNNGSFEDLYQSVTNIIT
jgi:hypothetical protein